MVRPRHELVSVLRALSVSLISRPCSVSLRLLVLCGTVVAPMLASATEVSDSVEHVIPPAQEEVLAKMLGRGVALPGECRFAGGGANGPIITAEYTCRDGRVVLELRHPDDAPPDALRTQQFAVVMRSASVPPGLAEALAALIRSHEAAFEWKQLSGERAPPPLGLIAGACGIVIVGLVAQYLVDRRRGAPEASRRRHLAREFAVTVSGLYRCRKGPGDLRVLLLLGLVAGYLLTRLILLTRLPVFVDESIHISWAQGPIGRDLIAECSVGKWLPIQLMRIFMLLPLDPLFGARLASVSMGLATLLACVLINRELFSLTEGLLAGFIYAILPFAFLYDRLALADIYLTAFGAWAMFFSIAMRRREGVIYPLAMALSTCAAILSKPTGGLFILTPLLVSVLLVERDDRAHYLGRAMPTLITSMVLLAFLLRGGYGTRLVTSQSDFEGAAYLRRLLPNFEVSCQWFTSLLTPVLACAAVAALAGALGGILRKASREALLAAVFLVSFTPYVLVSTTWYPNYLLFTVVPISLLLARGITVCVATLSRLAGRHNLRLAVATRIALFAITVIALVGASARRDLALIADPENAGLPLVEHSRYISGWVSGYGLPELATFLRDQAQQRAMNVVRFDLAGPPNQGLDVYLIPTGSIQMYTIDHLDKNAAAEITRLARTRRTLFISNPEGEAAFALATRGYLGSAVRIWNYVRPGAQSTLEVWEVGSSSP